MWRKGEYIIMKKNAIKQMKKFIKSYGLLNGVVLAIAIATLPATCGWIAYQPSIPECLRDLSLGSDDSKNCEKNNR